MRRSWTPSIVPNGHDQNFYIVVNNYGKLGPAFAETDLGEADLETAISDLMSGQYDDPVRFVAFNTSERWSEDASRWRLCAALILPAVPCPRRLCRSSTATSVRTVN